MNENSREKIIDLFLLLNDNNKQHFLNAIADAMSPLVDNYKCVGLSKIYNEYLETLWSYKKIDLSLIHEYENATTIFLNENEYDEYSYESFNDPSFTSYLCYIGKESIRYCLEENKAVYGRISLNAFIEVNEVLDEFYYQKVSNKSEKKDLDSLLYNITLRIMENACETMLLEILYICNGFEQNNKVYLLKKSINNYKKSLKNILKI